MRTLANNGTLSVQLQIRNDPNTGCQLTVTGVTATQGRWNAPAPNYGDQITYGGPPYQCSATQPDIQQGGVIVSLLLRPMGQSDAVSLQVNFQINRWSVMVNGNDQQVYIGNNLWCYLYASPPQNNVLTAQVEFRAATVGKRR